MQKRLAITEAVDVIGQTIDRLAIANDGADYLKIWARWDDDLLPFPNVHQRVHGDPWANAALALTTPH